MTHDQSVQWLKWSGGADHKPRRLICFGHAGSTYADFVRWKEFMGDDVKVLAVSLPGRCERIAENPVRDLSELVGPLVRAICKLPPCPTTLFGHSFGGVLAYETAREIVAIEPDIVNSIVISACGLSSSTALDGVDINDKDAVLRAFIKRGYLMEEHLENSKLIDLVLPYLLSDIVCKQGWQPTAKPNIDIPIHSFAWAHDHLVTPGAIAAWQHKSTQPDLCKHVVFPGQHLEYMTHPAAMFTALRDIVLTQHRNVAIAEGYA